jgi:hypothetical protein
MTLLALPLPFAVALGALHVDASASPTLLRSDRSTRGLSLDAASRSNTGGWGISAGYESANCTGGVPVTITAKSSGCVAEDSSSDVCYSTFDIVGSSSLELENTVTSTKGQCVVDLSATLNTLYGDQVYIRIDFFSDSSCSDPMDVNVHSVDGACHIMGFSNGDSLESGSISKTVNAWDNGTVSLSWFYNTSDCSGAPDTVLTFTKEQLSSGKCQTNSRGTSSIGYSNAVEVNSTSTSSGSGSGSSSSSGLSIGAIVGLVAGCVMFLV